MKRMMLAGWMVAAALAAVAAWGQEPEEDAATVPVAEWTMWNTNNGVVNAGSGGEQGNLELTTGAVFSDDVPIVNTGGTALRFMPASPTAAAQAAGYDFDPLAGAEKFTIMAWVKRESLAGDANPHARIFSDMGMVGSETNGVEFLFDGSLLTLAINGKSITANTGRIAPDNGTWRHVAVVYDGTLAVTNVYFYIDGVQSGAGRSLGNRIPGENVVGATVGNSAAGRSEDTLMAGCIDDVFVFRDWAPEPSGNGNLNPAIREWMLVDDSTRIPEDEGGDEDEDEWNVPPVMVEDTVAQKIGEERMYEDLREGLIFVNADTGDLWYANEENPHGRAICVCKPFPNWHRFQDTVYFLGHVLQLNDHYSMQAEAHSLSVRYGGEAVWRILGDEGGDLAGILTVEVEDENHLLIQANATGTNVALQVCTNLMEATPWKPAENAVIYTQTDAATTWRATLLDFEDKSGLELYRVLNGNNPRPAGVYCERPLRANRGIVVPDGQSISMGGVERYEWPDTSGIASNRLAIGAVATNLATHAARTDNPHNVTAAQIGALTAETDATALAALATHEADTNNPHAVTAAQAGAVPATWDNGWEIDTQTNGLSVKGGDWEAMRVYTNENGSTHANFGYHASTAVVGFDAGTVDIGTDADTVSIGAAALKLSIGRGFNSTNFHIYKNPKFPDGLTSSNVTAGSVTAGSLTIGEGTCTNLSELATAASVSAVSGRVSAIEADYVQAADIADFATTQAVASVERRTEALEERAEEYWCQWSTDSLEPLPATNWIPTNWPARRVLCFVPNSTTTGYRIALPNWDPDADCELRLGLWKAATNNFQSILLEAGGGNVSSLTGNGAQGRECILRYKVGVGWVFTAHTYTGVPYHIKNGIRRNINNSSLPEDEKFAPVTE